MATHLSTTHSTQQSVSRRRDSKTQKPQRRLNRSERLLNKIKQKPGLALKDKRCRKPEFCKLFLDHCIDRALQAQSTGVELANIGLELAALSGEPHLRHRAEGVRVHAYIAATNWDQAAEYLEGYRAAALTCCKACAADWYVRQGDLLVEQRDPEAAGIALTQSVENLGSTSGDAYGRIAFVSGLEYFYKGDPGYALRKVEDALIEIDLASPRGHFMDGSAFLSCFLQKTFERLHTEQALEIAEAFKQRILGLKDWTDVRTRLAWVEGQLHARLNHWKAADQRLDAAGKALVRQGPDRYALAAAVDHCLLYTHRPSDDSRRRILAILGSCDRRLKQLEPELKKRLRFIKSVISRQPRNTPLALTTLRRSFIVPVAAIVPGAPWHT